MKIRLIEIIREIKGAIEEENLTGVLDPQIIDLAMRRFNSESIGQAKEEQDFNKATDKQIEFLSKLGYKGTTDITKKEARGLIDEYKSKKR